jgi:hypothetical protein
MTGYQIQNCTLRCSRTGRELQPGEKYFSVLYEKGGGLVREDFSKEAWQGPPEGAFSFWLGKVPPRDQSRKLHIDDEVLFDCFVRLAEDKEPQRVNFRFIVALLLMRRKRLKFEDTEKHQDEEVLVLRDSRSKALHRVLNPRLSEQQLAEVQEEVQKVLGIA